MPFAACVLLAIALGIVAYRSGLKRGADSAQQQTISTAPSTASLEEQISDFGHERAQLLAKLADEDSVIKNLKLEVATQTEDIKQLKPTVDQPATGVSAENTGRDTDSLRQKPIFNSCKQKPTH